MGRRYATLVRVGVRSGKRGGVSGCARWICGGEQPLRLVGDVRRVGNERGAVAVGKITRLPPVNKI
jgi:hypothetical protein